MNYKIIVNKEKLYNKKDFSNIEFKKIVSTLNEEYIKILS